MNLSGIRQGADGDGFVLRCLSVGDCWIPIRAKLSMTVPVPGAKRIQPTVNVRTSRIENAKRRSDMRQACAGVSVEVRSARGTETSMRFLPRFLATYKA